MTQASANLSTDINNVIKYWEIYPDKYIEEFFGIKLSPVSKDIIKSNDKGEEICQFH